MTKHKLGDYISQIQIYKEQMTFSHLQIQAFSSGELKSENVMKQSNNIEVKK